MGADASGDRVLERSTLFVAGSGIHDAVRGWTEGVHAQSCAGPCEGAWLMALISAFSDTH